MHTHFTQSSPLAQFFAHALPAVLGLVLTSGIVIADGLFIGNIVGRTGLASVNLTLPVLYLFLGITIMIGVGGAVKAGHALGAKDPGRAARYFSLTLGLAILVTSLLAVLCIALPGHLLDLLGCTPDLRQSVAAYLGTLVWFYPAMMAGILFSIFMRTEGRPGLSLAFTATGNLVNLVLDYLMITRWGLAGAALASGISVAIPVACGIFYFSSGRSAFRFTTFSWDLREIGHILFNGSSEMIGQAAVGTTTWCFNRVILSRMGVDGVAAYTILGYTAFIQFMIVTGFAAGLASIVGYSWGAGKTGHIRMVMKTALASGFAAGLACWLLLVFASRPIAGLFAPDSPHIPDLAAAGFSLFGAGFLFNGFNIVITAYFTAIGRAGSSALIALLRGLVLVNLFVLALPGLFGDTGIWLSFPLAELVTLALAALLYRQECQKQLTAPAPDIG